MHVEEDHGMFVCTPTEATRLLRGLYTHLFHSVYDRFLLRHQPIRVVKAEARVTIIRYDPEIPLMRDPLPREITISQLETHNWAAERLVRVVVTCSDFSPIYFGFDIREGASVLCVDAIGSRFMELDPATAILLVHCTPSQYHRLNRRALKAVKAVAEEAVTVEVSRNTRKYRTISVPHQTYIQ
ncbi:hypothetical protein LINGRAHAP2_LOCUS22945 [Linum grandiflorum]